MEYVLKCKHENKSYVLHVHFWSFHDFERIQNEDFSELNTVDMKNDFMNMFARIEHTFFDHGFTCFLGYDDPCALTSFIDSHQAKILNCQFGLLCKSSDANQHPHFLSIDVYLLEKEIDPVNAYGANREGVHRTPSSSLPCL